jgi:DNA-binding transcriptional LysR family regulator
MDTLLGMRMFSRVVDAGSFSAAADQMNCSTASVSRAVSMLENRLCTRLLHRTTRSLSLTESGQLYYTSCKRILADLDDAEAQAGGADAPPHGTLHVHCSPDLGLRQFTQSIVQYQRQHPRVKVHVTFRRASTQLIEDRIDVSIVTASSLPDSGNVSRLVGEIEQVLVAGPNYLRAYPMETFDDLAEHSLTAIPTHVSPHERNGGLGVAKPASTVRKAPLIIDDLEATRFAVLAGAGVAALPLHCVVDDIRLGLLVQLFPAYRLPRKQVFALYASRRHVDAKIRTFVDFLATHFPDVLQTNSTRNERQPVDGYRDATIAPN